MNGGGCATRAAQKFVSGPNFLDGVTLAALTHLTQNGIELSCRLRAGGGEKTEPGVKATLLKLRGCYQCGVNAEQSDLCFGVENLSSNLSMDTSSFPAVRRKVEKIADNVPLLRQNIRKYAPGVVHV